MNTEQIEQRSLHISQEKILAFVSKMIGANVGREDDEHPLKPGPWGPVIREALKETYVLGPQPEPWRVFGPRPEPWRTNLSVSGPSPEPWRVALSSLFEKYPALYDLIPRGVQKLGEEVSPYLPSLPRRLGFLATVAHTVINRIELLHEVADATANEGERRGNIVVGGYLSRFCDDFCGNGFVLVWPPPEPRPWWFPTELTAVDLMVMASQFHDAAKEAYSHELRQHLADASARFLEAGLERMR